MIVAVFFSAARGHSCPQQRVECEINSRFPMHCCLKAAADRNVRAPQNADDAPRVQPLWRIIPEATKPDQPVPPAKLQFDRCENSSYKFPPPGVIEMRTTLVRR